MRKEEEIEGIYIGKEEVKLYVWRKHDPVHKYSKNSTIKPLELINKFMKVSGNKISVRKSVVFLYNSKKHSKHENKKGILFKTAFKRK